MNTDRDHLDAETVAAWLDGGLDPASLAAAEAHASNCERCQALLATVVKIDPLRTRLPAPGTLPFGSRFWRWWMAPIAATAAAVTLWMVVPQEQVQRIATEPAPAVTAPAAPAPAEPAGARDEAPSTQARRQAEQTPGFQEKKPVAQTTPDTGAKVAVADTAVAKARQDDKEERLARVEAEPQRAPAAPPAAAAPATASAEAGALRENASANQLRQPFAPVVILSPDPRFRWRASAAGIERSEDSGRTWFVVRLPQGEVITAGDSSGPSVCWVVGRRGVVLVATDGTNFTPLPFPEPVDLVAVSSPELRVAVVTAADGRVFRTENAGRSWRLQQ